MILSQPLGFAAPTDFSKPPKKLSFQEFSQNIEQEFIKGSGIAPSLYAATVDLVTDIEPLPGGEVSYPIHEALGWNYTRFGKQANANLYAAVLKNENGFAWQLKLSNPRQAKGKIQKYETPLRAVGGGARAFLPTIPVEVRALIGQRYGTAMPPPEDSFWDWLEAHPQIPIVVTEGGKKGLAGFSQGYVVLSLYGCNGGYRSKDDQGNSVKPYLIPDVARFAVPGRRFVLAFDQDEAEKTRRRVNIALSRFSALLCAQGCEVAIAQWQVRQGKGLDDLIVQFGAEAWDQAYEGAIAYSEWQILQRLERQMTFPADLTVNEGDLSKLDLAQIPEEGIVALMSAKGTGKTKLITSMVADQEKVLAITHRIALGRNLCARLGLDYRSDIDKVKGEYINGEGYTLRIGSCVDGLLSIDPAKFVGCDLVLDEVTQVLRHLLTSSTCSREGKRPVLLARFGELVRNAHRLILADADLDNATLNYLRELRGEDQRLFLIRNQFQAQPYDCQFIQAPDRTAITSRLLDDTATLETGKVLFVTTDSKATSESLARIIEQHYPQKRILILNSKTTGGEMEREFMEKPDIVLARGDYDLIICSPSVATGVSIECQGIISKVYGIFTGVSSTDGDISQSLSRVREPVQRIIWCAKTGSNYSPVSRSLNSMEIKYHLQTTTVATLQLIRSSLRADIAAGLEKTDWQSDPNIRLYCQLAAEQNHSMKCLREALLTRLKWEGNAVQVEECASDKGLKELLAQTRQELKQLNAEAIVAADTLTYSEVLVLEQKESLSQEEVLAIFQHYLRDFYCVETLTVEDCLWDNEGRRRGEILNLEVQLFPDVGVERTARSLEKQATWNQSYCPWDISHAPLRRWLREQIGLTELIHRMIDGWRWSIYDLKPYADKARDLAAEIKMALHLTISPKMKDTQVVHQLLSQLGLKFRYRWSSVMEGHRGEKLRVYELDKAHWERVWDVLQRRRDKRLRLAQAATQSNPNQGEKPGGTLGSPVSFESINQTGDPVLEGLEAWLTAESVADVKQMWVEAQGDSDALQQVYELVPEAVRRYLGLVA